MKDKTSEGFEATCDEFTEVLDKFKKIDTKTYYILIDSGDRYKEVIFKLCQRILNIEEVPESSQKSVLVMIWKRKGPMDTIKNNIFLHMESALGSMC